MCPDSLALDIKHLSSSEWEAPDRSTSGQFYTMSKKCVFSCLQKLIGKTVDRIWIGKSIRIAKIVITNHRVVINYVIVMM